MVLTIQKSQLYGYIVFFKDCVDEMYETIVDAILGKKVEKKMEEIKNETPAPLNTMLEKQPRSDAIQKKKIREGMLIHNVPPTNPGRMHVS